MRRTTAVAALAFLAGLMASHGVRAGSDEDAYRKMLDGARSKGTPAADGPSSKPELERRQGAAPVRSAAPKPKVVRAPAPKGPACDQEFATLHAKNDAAEKYYAKVCFVEEQCSRPRKCELLKNQYAEFARLERIASGCRSLPDAQAWAEKYRKWVANGPEVLQTFCGAR